MNVASLDLSRELFELSGWDGEYPDLEHWYKELEPNVYTIGDIPKYNLGYLLRRLPAHSEVLVFHHDSGVEYVAMSLRATEGIEDVEAFSRLMPRADTPEDAVARLCIELFKQGVLTREAP
jgi:hypothetical protein